MTHGPDLYSSESDKFDWRQIVLTDVLLNNRFIRGSLAPQQRSYWLQGTCRGLLNPLGPLRRLGSKIMKKKLEIIGKEYRC